MEVTVKSKTYGKRNENVKTLRGVSLSIKEGEFVGIWDLLSGNDFT